MRTKNENEAKGLPRLLLEMVDFLKFQNLYECKDAS